MQKDIMQQELDMILLQKIRYIQLRFPEWIRN